MTQLTATELLALADRVRLREFEAGDVDTAYHCILELVALKQAAGKGVTEEVAQKFERAYFSSGSLSPLGRTRDGLLAVAPMLAAQNKTEWRCFHCDEVFVTVDSAQEHFGKSMTCTSACQIDVAEYRVMEQRMQRYNEEDSELHRAMYGMRNQHQLELQREEEKGYARGLRDGASQPEPSVPVSKLRELTDQWRNSGNAGIYGCAIDLEYLFSSAEKQP